MQTEARTSGRPAMIDVRDLPPGRHVLWIGRAPLPVGGHNRDDLRVWTIAF